MVTSDLLGAYPLAYCPPGSICGMLSIPRALPPVTHGSALQAPERLRGSCDLTTHPYRTDVSQALCCLEGSTMSNLVHRRRWCAWIVQHSIMLPGGQYARGKGRFILIYRLAMDARPWRGDGVAG